MTPESHAGLDAARDTLRRELATGFTECKPVELKIPSGVAADSYRHALWEILEPARNLMLVTEPELVYEAGHAKKVCFTAGGASNASRVGLVAIPGCGDPAGGSPGAVLRVTPKVSGADWPGLLALALGNARIDLSDVPVTAEGWDDPVAIIVRAYLGSLKALGTIRRHFDERRETLRGRVRGRLEVDRWVGQLARGRPDRAPCRFTAHDLDNLPNRALLRALRLCQGLLSHLPEAHRALQSHVRAAEMILAGVPDDVSLRASSTERVRLPRSFSRYESTGAWPLANLILRRFVPVSAPGGRRTAGFSVEMPWLFEDALRTALGGRAEHWSYRVGDVKEPELKPDIVVESQAIDSALDQATIIVDAKWKACIRTNNPLERVNERDIYQVLAYARYQQLRMPDAPIVPILVYPSPEAAPSRPLEVYFGPPGGDKVVCYLTAWPIGRSKEAGPLRERARESIRRCVRAHFDGAGAALSSAPMDAVG